MAGEQPKAKGGRRRGRRAVGVGALLLVAWLAGRGFMVGGALPATQADATRPDVAPLPKSTTGASTPAAPAAESQAAAARSETAAPSPDAAGVEPDRFAALSAALALHAERGELAACAAAWRHLQGLPLSATQRATCEAAVQSARRVAAERLGQAGALLAAGRAAAAVRALAPLLAAPHQDVTALELLPADVAAALAPLLAAQLANDAALPAPRPLARGRSVAVWFAGGEARGVVVAADAESVTLQVRQADGASFPRAGYLACDPDAVTGAEAVELGLAAARAGEPTLARAWRMVAQARGAGGQPRYEQLAQALR